MDRQLWRGASAVAWLPLLAAGALAGCQAGGVPGAPDGQPAPAPTPVAGAGGAAAAPKAAPVSGTSTSFDPNALLGPATLGPGSNEALRAIAAPLQRAAAASGVSADVLGAVAWAESRADPTVAGGGLMQMSDEAFAAQKTAHPEVTGALSDAAANATAAAFYLLQLQATMQQRYGRGDLGITLRAYNSGENGVDPVELTRTPAGTGSAPYVDNVTAYARVLATGGGNLPP